jgi:hypothetical protein
MPTQSKLNGHDRSAKHVIAQQFFATFFQFSGSKKFSEPLKILPFQFFNLKISKSSFALISPVRQCLY